ncbi:hypothetical protein A3B21_00680 [Candidatus Uhrbacteria bacterium RIFCSPLOWO2_01_FULL_47_24]|uniref:ABC transmembrane type-1 domain-containing protein n=1 Tax=Candidatus Uhrbacteria bacterium RIFCSPLOWO2_01_FULL_47_24 TaxID=1802401 RepID=A0A1F7UNP6_9BACT|nr:MAG: hypothetical protein A2753_04850 [Candidatus Uhrbacteria bacterium RIFCSPHIGHO2_01_FULL_47_11]OGL67687.1 MAG: hypothetical protein A3D58_04570 [Candidatus Uhrbacteria bacterium RIFCSPHIGHO2_02_FULL_46_47]OGL74870.1 MAG: hypothetical protein A3F52_00335 [Candidatus Uhrbacteria bacterium RIFCSPHIGHO2_12_FULL_47_11]OGL79892.1 MAG: hypothetical protein A3B21_00680 [Candidatus Uhrbacteria bacterium RIFCSPLOWO2_01_FULL_47_24]OGL84112.1 MAG: hypothetical protein A3J03_03475 [Candidatus Uhrbact
MGTFLQTLRTVLLDVVADFFYTPVWWYTRGLLKQMRAVSGSLAARQDALGISVWIKNISKPMYGQYDIAGRIISFFMRLAQIIGRSIVLIIWAGLLLIWLMIWVLIPVGIVYLIWLQIPSP